MTTPSPTGADVPITVEQARELAHELDRRGSPIAVDARTALRSLAAQVEALTSTPIAALILQREELLSERAALAASLEHAQAWAKQETASRDAMSAKLAEAEAERERNAALEDVLIRRRLITCPKCTGSGMLTWIDGSGETACKLTCNHCDAMGQVLAATPPTEAAQPPAEPGKAASIGTEHEVKCHPDPFNAMRQGAKCFEWRKDDRNYQVGDRLLVREWTPSASGEETPGGGYTGRTDRYFITYKLAGRFGVPEGFCVLGIRSTLPTKPAAVAVNLPDAVAAAWAAISHDFDGNDCMAIAIAAAFRVTGVEVVP